MKIQIFNLQSNDIVKSLIGFVHCIELQYLLTFDGYILDGRVFEVRYSVLNDVLSLTAPDNKSPCTTMFHVYTLVFNGFDLKQEELRRWLRTASKQVHNVIK